MERRKESAGEEAECGSYTTAVLPQNSAIDLPKAIRVYHATRSLAFAGIPAIDMKDRLALLTVASGLRRVGVLETWGQSLPKIRDRLISCGLVTSLAHHVWSTIERSPETPHRSVLEALDRRRIANKPKHVIWLFAGLEEREQYRQATFTQQQAGSLLRYPPCCVAFESTVMAMLPKAQLDFLTAEAGATDDRRLLESLSNKGQVPVPKIPLPDNALRTEQRLPFVLHVACDACLEDPGSPSVELNDRYGELLREIDADFHALFFAVQKTYCRISKDQARNRELLDHIRALHGNFFPLSAKS